MKDKRPRELYDSFTSDSESINNLKVQGNEEELKEDQEDLRNWYPELDENPLDKGEPLPENPEITHRMAACINFTQDTLSLASNAINSIIYRKEVRQENFETNRNTTEDQDDQVNITKDENEQGKLTQMNMYANV